MAGETAGATALPGKADRRGQPSLGALGGTRTPTMLLTATSRQRVYQFRHERLNAGCRRGTAIDGADVTNRECGDKARKRRVYEAGSTASDGSRQHLLDFDRNPVAIDQH